MIDFEGDLFSPTRRRVLRAAGAAATTALFPTGPTRAAADEKGKRPLRPSVVAFDVIETLFDLRPLRDRLKEAGLPAEALGVWFALMLRDAMALTITGVYKPFADVAKGTLEVMLTEAKVAAKPDRLEAVLAGFAELPAHPDVAPAFERLRDAKVRIVTLTNGSAENTGKLLVRSKLKELVEQTITVDVVKKWKPAKDVYLRAADAAKVEPVRMALVAAHDWDCHGAKRAGLVAGFVARKGKGFHPAMDPPDVQGPTLKEVIDGLLALPAS
ncbi:haloacid dehalogenase : Cryptic haloacid dehalogenase 1 OS=Loktanella cinnabarina LL-001 GN=MBE-LCI_0390 PE=4 SV=1: HAD_2 [Gemmataceae bacterium]|nr:haloacid dehalogenase : Cryptic haloacid dehalogenase 1 OS=Loktanella cinnabarina LL-001 GN=MBE-LCI_0390 PE=4 SV=1: HAD_2 [Gemmataceae bacterium]VTT99546.1 haloacid dehalogenase : Cryptic haloacid dehalogenase 1 OS=Loktanella cinnabarina LL-001 GN=MBE-LCI_0390 PE=4 SV=1: HAD_2 [Gemmataceae bacterium]